MAKNLLICFDGTWSKGKKKGKGANDDEATNVWRLFQLATGKNEDTSAVCIGDEYQQGKGSSSAYTAPQIAWYDAGVGTTWYERLRGGLFGYGLDENILQGYQVLTELYEDGDKIFLCGFSRGAYTARSLAGLIAMCGLIDRRKVAKLVGSFDKSFFADLMQDACASALTLYRDKGENARTHKNIAAFREQYTRSVPIECIAIWDTVKALGFPPALVKCLPLNIGEQYNAAHYAFHNHALSSIVHHGYHALAIDEHRADFAPVLWDESDAKITNLSISGRTTNNTTHSKQKQYVEQRWFSGSHSDVGGGYASRALSDQSLKWMCTKLSDCGLHLHEDFVLKDTPSQCQSVPYASASLAPITDSFRDFYKMTWRLHRCHLRPLHVENSTVKLDSTVFERIVLDPSYRPQNDGLADLLAWTKDDKL